MLAVGVILAAIAYGMSGWLGVEGLGYSLLLCLAPGLLTVYLSDVLKKTDMAPYVVLLGGGFRLVFVLLGMFGVSAARPELGFREFTVWLIISYLVALALETTIVLIPSPDEKSTGQA
jgi:hypothetical protein